MFKPIQIGLTGSIGMGKSAVAKQFTFMGFPVFDADAAVHRLYTTGGHAVALVRQHFPSAVIDDSVDRAELSRCVLSDPGALKELEGIIHPLVADERNNFLDSARRNGSLAVIYDIPLLFENRKNHEVDCIVVVTASTETQRRRVMERSGMSEGKFEAILAKQVPDIEKREMADYIINTDFSGYAQARAQLSGIVANLLERYNDRWTHWLQPPPKAPLSGSGALRDLFDVVVFDLDDTLVPVLGPIRGAHEGLVADVKRLMPLSASAILTDFRGEMAREIERDPLIAHDYTAIKASVLQRLSTPFGESEHIDTVLRRFVAKRSDVSSFLYEDSLPCLRMLSQEESMPLALFTNGNASIGTKENATCELGSLLSLSVTAGELGVMKPSPVCFLALSQMLGTHPSRILYVGDSYEHDVVGAKGVGMHCALLTRPDHKERNTATSRAITPDIELNSLDPTEFRLKVMNYVVHQLS